ncbi:MAG: glycoside hydrolase family 130 protein [Bacilli bacterium]|jgi:predicted GH43/DUF377 family glycosyl hydrolase
MEKHLIIKKNDVVASREDFFVLGVFNPAAIKVKDTTILLVRVAEAVRPTVASTIVIPTVSQQGLEFIQLNRQDSSYDFTDARVIRNHRQNYLTSLSHFRVATSDDGLHFAFGDVKIMPETEYESYGIEDPRITEISGVFYITYSAISPFGINVALMRTKDFRIFERLGIIFPFDNKDCVIFPRRINGKYYALHRPSKSDFGSLDIWTAESRDLLHWGNHKVLLDARLTYQESKRLGAGATPFLTERGWVVIYHSADDKQRYHLTAMLLDKNNPNKVLARSRKPLISPTEEYEINGFFSDVVFTCGLTKDGDKLTIYYGVCDENIACCTMAMDEIWTNMEEVKNESA